MSIGKHSRTPLMAACAKGQLEVRSVSLSLSLSLSPSPPPPSQVVNHLLGVTGVELDAQDSDGMTALMHAARGGSLEVPSFPHPSSCLPSCPPPLPPLLSDHRTALDQRLQSKHRRQERKDSRLLCLRPRLHDLPAVQGTEPRQVASGRQRRVGSKF
jgi:ankyrin repeat protein